MDEEVNSSETPIILSKTVVSNRKKSAVEKVKTIVPSTTSNSSTDNTSNFLTNTEEIIEQSVRDWKIKAQNLEDENERLVHELNSLKEYIKNQQLEKRRGEKMKKIQSTEKLFAQVEEYFASDEVSSPTNSKITNQDDTLEVIDTDSVSSPTWSHSSLLSPISLNSGNNSNNNMSELSNTAQIESIMNSICSSELNHLIFTKESKEFFKKPNQIVQQQLGNLEFGSLFEFELNNNNNSDFMKEFSKLFFCCRDFKQKRELLNKYTKNLEYCYLLFDFCETTLQPSIFHEQILFKNDSLFIKYCNYLKKLDRWEECLTLCKKNHNKQLLLFLIEKNQLDKSNHHMIYLQSLEQCNSHCKEANEKHEYNLFIEMAIKCFKVQMKHSIHFSCTIQDTLLYFLQHKFLQEQQFVANQFLPMFEITQKRYVMTVLEARARENDWISCRTLLDQYTATVKSLLSLRSTLKLKKEAPFSILLFCDTIRKYKGPIDFFDYCLSLIDLNDNNLDLNYLFDYCFKFDEKYKNYVIAIQILNILKDKSKQETLRQAMEKDANDIINYSDLKAKLNAIKCK